MNTPLALAFAAALFAQAESSTTTEEAALQAKLEGERERVTELQTDNERLESRIAELEAQLDSLRAAESEGDVAADGDQEPDSSEPTDI